jgi:HAD superfamily phosphoserine phosphatase-like hydrolase
MTQTGTVPNRPLSTISDAVSEGVPTSGSDPGGDTAFLFDFDGTITAAELLPLIAREVGLEDEIGALTRDTMAGYLPFDESFRSRVELLRATPIARVAEIVAEAPVFPRLLDWIVENRDRCWVVTGNLDCWVAGWMERHGLRFFASTAAVEGGAVAGVASVLHKESVLGRFAGRRTVMVGDGANDAQIMADADVGIGFATLHDVPSVVLEVADWVVLNEDALCRTLSQL